MSFAKEPEPDKTEERKTKRLESERLERLRRANVLRNTTAQRPADSVNAQPSFFKQLLGGS